jgi:hypothetical protein
LKIFLTASPTNFSPITQSSPFERRRHGAYAFPKLWVSTSLIQTGPLEGRNRGGDSVSRPLDKDVPIVQGAPFESRNPGCDSVTCAPDEDVPKSWGTMQSTILQFMNPAEAAPPEESA